VRAEINKQKKIADHYSFLRDQNLAMYAYQANLHYALPEELKKIDWDMAALPVFKELPGIGSQTYPTYFGITSMSQNQGQAMETIKYLTSDEFQLELSRNGLMPVLNDESVKKALGAGSEFKGKNFASIFYHKFAPIAPYKTYAPKVESVYKAQTIPLATGTVDLNTAFRIAEEEAKKTIAESKSR
ncbi:MAG: extracellular solute-binding protein family 1, partial [Paenibacillus sp.]|nr:extracellular solute-binding protein family 1 [Paenibacillus sp.]